MAPWPGADPADDHTRQRWAWSRIIDSAVFRAAIDRIIPEDEWPGGWAGGVGSYLRRAGPELHWAGPGLTRLIDTLDRHDFGALPITDQDAVLDGLEQDPESAADLATLRRVCWEGYYAQSRLPDGDWHRPVGLTMIDFKGVPDGVRPVEPELPRSLDAAQLKPHYDAIVIGSGPGGGVAAQVLAQAGRTVLIIERAVARSNHALRGDHLHGKRNAVYRSVVGPGPGHPRLADLGPSAARTVDGDDDMWAYGLNAYAYGGGTRIWQGMAWRFFPEDFAMATHYGNPPGRDAGRLAVRLRRD